MKTLNLLINKIENQRKELIRLASNYSFSSPEVVQASTALDQMLNQFELYKENSRR
ncbi:aspartyl-phosphate phosphatase Spo0E family protein [Bacillus suaedaesalsae]|uniref:Aspartyl-phosphate phosphatase Spo0E family protein n=1 Tax=Bacillus suaedaesalsae TaxID=2810349 RepID=A0ABS2DCN9_9BACI|nr:aspartyl-phosphate phosphatase Spo0E family protein [Bacillus suaedaesalsae]MBM6616197.1 aspartyl-phosphate phosphatase Spo0E family protein [Bacillus suaedaesalsae]